MAKLVAGKLGFDMTAVDFSDFTSLPTKETSTEITEVGASGATYDFIGKNFKYSANIPQSGTITGFTFIDPHGHTEVTVTGGSMPVKDAFAFFESNDLNGFESEFFKGKDTLTGSAKADVLEGFGGNDTLKGGGGADTLDGGDGHDTFVYAKASDSTSTKFDTIDGIDFNNSDSTSDTLKLPSAVDAIDSEITKGKLTTAKFDAQLAKAVSASHLGAHDAVLFDPSSGGEKHQFFLVVDLNGTAGYQAGQDLVIHLTDAMNTSDLGTSDFTT